jgi:2-keto-4-pentenoate hydratase/2-oxohepta-3-ene-1,7-dioic acid hydratase in catechol pathway
MKLATIHIDGQNCLGVLHSHEQSIFNITAAAARASKSDRAFSCMLGLIDAGPNGLDEVRSLIDSYIGDEDLSVEISASEILAPLPEPRQMRDGMSFGLHITQASRGMQRLIFRGQGDLERLKELEVLPLADLPEIYTKQPIFYITNRFSVGGTNTVINWPRYSKIMDYELELAVVTTGMAENVTPSKARDHIFGFTIFNDFSARDTQCGDISGWLGPAKSKSFKGGNVLGPWIVTLDEIGDPYNLQMKARVNGETRCSSTSQNMLFSFEEIIAYISTDETIMPGEVIGSGTVGNGCGLEIDRFLEDGDTVELEISKIGTLKNTVKRQSK